MSTTTTHAASGAGEGVKAPPITILYTNWRGETAVRRIRIDFIAYGNEALGFGWGSNEWHPEEQMLLSAFDVDKGERRTFALAGIKAWGEEAVNAALAAETAPTDREALRKALTEITDAADKMVLSLPGHWHDDATIELTDAAGDARRVLSTAVQNDLYDVTTGAAR